MHHRPRPRRRRVLSIWAAVLGVLAAVVVPAAATVDTVAHGEPAGAATAASSSSAAYWMVASDGGVFSCGGAQFYGSTGALRLNAPIVGMAATPDDRGYWLVASDGGIFTFGDARFFGSTGGLRLNRPIVGMAATPDGGGYWLVAADGGIFSFGDARFSGSTGNLVLNRPVVGMASTLDGRGYWLVAADGGIFSFGDAPFYGSTGNLRLNQPIVSMTTTPDGQGYRFVAADGGVFTFGDAQFEGSLGGIPQGHPVVGLAATPDGRGYWMANTNGGVTNFGDATYWGSAPQVLARPVVGMAETTGSGGNACSAYTSGSFGYDVSKFQCGALPGGPHAIGIVEVDGRSKGALNPCLASETQWAGSGLNLYTFLTWGQDAASGDGNCATQPDPAACNYGFNAATSAFGSAQGAGANTQVAWWLDVESYSLPPLPPWSSSVSSNASLVQGAIDGLHAEGVNSVGVYASPGVWSGIVGSYAPDVPYWAADWELNPATTCGNIHQKYAVLPSGPVELVQYSSPSAPLALGGVSTAYDDDYAC